jgi:hypothetical protein
VQIACALSAWGATSLLGCGDGIYTPGAVIRRDASADPNTRNDAATLDGDASSAFMNVPDAQAVEIRPMDPILFTTKSIGFNGGSVTQGAATLTFPLQAYSPASYVTIREVPVIESGHRGPFSPVFELTFSRGKPQQKPTFSIKLSGVFDSKGKDVSDLADSLVLRRLQPDKAQWIELVAPNVKLIVDPLSPPSLQVSPFDFLPDDKNRMYIGVLLSCGASGTACTSRSGFSSCRSWCTDSSGLNMTCGMGDVCQ